ncbi:MAG: glycosyltransferase family 4 protein [Candidatus Kerfeldbacteria bacterium]|nr:glycosyltransferase family 4 protein [Candidatus Kerfeldbacteria bacterium]
MNYSRIVFVKSHTMASEVARLYGVNPEKIAIVAGGIDEKDFQMKTESSSIEFRQKLGIPLGVYAVLYAGRIVPQKGLIYLVKAALRLVKEFNFVVVVAGASMNKSYAASINRLLRNKIHQRFFHFLGHIDQMEISRVFASVDCIVTPSIYEPFGMVNLQAASMGKTVITTDVTGSVDMLAQCPNVKVVPAGSIESLGAALREVLSLRRKKGQIPFNFRAYSWHSVAEQLARYFSLYSLKRLA